METQTSTAAQSTVAANGEDRIRKRGCPRKYPRPPMDGPHDSDPDFIVRLRDSTTSFVLTWTPVRFHSLIVHTLTRPGLCCLAWGEFPAFSFILFIAYH